MAKHKKLKSFLVLFYILCILLFAVDFIWPPHGHLAIEEWPGFYAVYGFLGCSILVFVSKFVLRPAVMKGEDYYD